MSADTAADTAALKRLITNLRTMATKADKSAANDKAARDAQKAELMGTYQTEEDTQEAYGYELITLEERDALMDLFEDRTNPNKDELTETEIYALEIRDLISITCKRLHNLEWDELSEEDKERILREKDEVLERRRMLKGGIGNA